MAADDSFHIFRRFSTLRVRLLLRRQDKLSLLEQKLGEIDGDEAKPVYLCCNRKDKNVERLNLVNELETELKLYGKQLVEDPNEVKTFLRC